MYSDDVKIKFRIIPGNLMEIKKYSIEPVPDRNNNAADRLLLID